MLLRDEIFERLWENKKVKLTIILRPCPDAFRRCSRIECDTDEGTLEGILEEVATLKA